MNDQPDVTALCAPRRQLPVWLWAGLTFVFCLSLFCLTGSKLRFGYLGENFDQAEAWLRGELVTRPEGGLEPFAKTGLIEVVAALPFVGVKVLLQKLGAAPGLQQLAHVFSEPFYTALLCLAFFGLALRLYASAGVAAFLTLVLALTTMVWPYSKFGMETQITLWTLVGIWALIGYAAQPTRACAAWIAVAIAGVMLTKITGVLHAAWLVGALAWLKLRGRWWTRPGARRDALIGGAIVVAGVVAFLLGNRWRFGGWVWGGRYGFGSEMQPIPFWESFWAFLASPNKSFLLYSPAALVALWFWGAFWRRFPVMRPVLVGAVAVTVFHLTARTWAEETWGPRRMHYLVPLAILPLGIWWQRRAGLRGWVRRLGWLALAFGLWVQAVAVSFDYTALAFTLGFNPVFSQENQVWDPQFNHLRFNLHLMRSAAHRRRTGESLPYVLDEHYMGWTFDGPEPDPQHFDVSGRDRLDFWYLQQQADWPGRPYWFVSASSWLVVVFAVGGLASFVALVCLIRRERAPSPAPPEPSFSS